jgi:hypothetical protein
MAITTALDLITMTLRKIGVHAAAQPVPPEESQDALDDLNLLFESWGLDGRIVARVADIPVPLVPGQATYTIGSGGQVNLPRPVTLHDGFTRVGDLDFPYTMIRVDQWASLAWKPQGQDWPEYVYYEETFPLGTLHPWPVPTAAHSLHLLADAPFTALALVTDTVSLAPGYRELAVYRLGRRLASEYRVALSAEFTDEARRIEDAIRRHRAQPVEATLLVPYGHERTTSADWIYTGGF